MDATGRAGITHPSVISPVFTESCVYSIFSSLFGVLWIIVCLSFDLRFLNLES